MPRPAPRLRRPAAADTVIAPEVYRLRALLAALEDLSLAALLRELGTVLYNREIQRWAVLSDISDELIDQATLDARRRITERMLETEALKKQRRRRA